MYLYTSGSSASKAAETLHGASGHDQLYGVALHAGWADANVAFMRSGGYALSARVRQVTQRVLLLWGRHDEIVDPMFAKRYVEDLRDCRRA